MKEAIPQSGEDQMAARLNATTSSPPLRAKGKQKIFPKPDIRGLKLAGGKTSAVTPQAQRSVAAPEKVLNPAKRSTFLESTTAAPLPPPTPSRVKEIPSPFKSERSLDDDNDKSICY